MHALPADPRPRHDAPSPGGVRRARRPLALWIVLAGATLGLSGCVGPAPSLEEAWPSTLEQFRDVESLRVSATLVVDGAPVAVELAGRVDDSAVSATTRRGDVTVESVSVDGATYVRSNAPDDTGSARALAEVPEGMWVRTSTGDAQDLSLARVHEEVAAQLPAAADLAGADVAATTVRVDGRVLHRYTGVPGLDPGTALFLDRDDRLARLEFEATDAPFTGTFDFEDWNETPAPTAPAESAVIDRPGL